MRIWHLIHSPIGQRTWSKEHIRLQRMNSKAPEDRDWPGRFNPGQRAYIEIRPGTSKIWKNRACISFSHIYIYFCYFFMYIPGPLTTVCFLRAVRNLKHLEKTACQNHDSESLRNATRAHKKTMPTL